MPQEKQNVAAQQNKVGQAKAQVMAYIQERGIDPQKMVQYGQLAEAVLRDKNLYPMFRQRAVQDKIVDANDLPPNPNPSVLAIFATMGKLVSK